MAKKLDVKGALTLGTKKKLTKKSTKNVDDIEMATKQIHTGGRVGRPSKNEEVKKTSLHIPLDLYKKLKIKSFEQGVTLRELIISTLSQEFS